jgi:uncharacterized membrane protein
MKYDLNSLLMYVIRVNGISHLQKDLEHELNSHPDFPTLKAVSDVLEKFGIENVPVRLSPEELKELDSPYLAYIKKSGHNELAYVKPLENGRIEYKCESESVKEEKLATFATIFTGIGVLLDLKNLSTPPINSNRLKERLLFKSIISLSFASIIAFLVISLYNNSLGLFSNFPSTLLFATKSLGLALATALVIKDLGESGSLFDKVCKVGRLADCNTVLESRFATIYGWLKWSDVGFIYFLSGLLLLANGNLGILTLLSLAAIPYALVSLYQQVFLLKKLCLFCLGVVTMLLTEFSLSISSIVNISLTSNELIYSFILIGLTGAFYLIIKALFLSEKTQTELEWRYNRLKRIPEVITEVVKRETPLIMPDMPIDSLSFGYSGADALKAHVFLSLHCGHCGRLFSQLNEQLNKGQKISIELFLNFDPRNGHQIDFAEEFLKRYWQNNAQTAWEALGQWYSKLNNGVFTAQKSEPVEAIKKVFLTTNRLMQANQISSLPKLYIEGFEKSSHYGLGEYLENVITIRTIHSENQREMIINT